MMNPDYCIECQICGNDFEMIWGREDSICEECFPNTPLHNSELNKMSPEAILYVLHEKLKKD